MYSVIINTNCGTKCLLNAVAIDIYLCLAYAISQLMAGIISVPLPVINILTNTKFKKYSN